MAFTSGNDFNIIQHTDLANVDAGAGDDVYIVTAATLDGTEKIQIVDFQGNNSLQLIGGLEIASSIVASDTVQLTLSNGSEITVTGASSFGFEPGGNITAGIDNEDVDYATFATATLAVDAVPEAGAEAGNGGAVTVGGGSTTDNLAPTAEADATTTDVDTAVTIAVLENDSDPEGDALTISSVSESENGATVAIVDVDNGDGTTTQQVEYTPAEGFEGTDTFTYDIDDGNGNTVTGTVSVEVGTVVVNEAPTAEADAATTDVDTAVTIAVLVNDSDPEADALTIAGVTSETGATVEIVDLEDGTQGVSYTPVEGFVGTDTFTYDIDDGNGNTVTGTVSVEVGTVVVNEAPTAEADTATTDVDTAVTIAVLVNDSDPEADALTIAGVTSTTGATVAIVDLDDGTQGVSYTPAAGFAGTDTFTYDINDGNGNTVTGTVSVEVTEPVVPEDTTPPVFTSAATADAVENQAVLYTAGATDDTAPITFTLAGADAELLTIIDGVVSLKEGVLDFDAGVKISYVFDVVATDSATALNSATQTVTVTVTDDVADNPVPDTTAPVLTSAATANAVENQNVLYTAGATDDTAPITFSLAGADAALLAIDASGVVTLAAGNLDFDAGVKTSYAFDVIATDGATPANASAPLAVTVTVTDDVTDNPTYAITAPATAEEGKSAVFTVATTNVVDGTVLAYTLTGVTADDLVDANADGDANPLTGVNPLVGTATVTGNATTITVALAEDAILDEVETLTATLDAPATGTANVLITDTSAPTKVAVTAANDAATPIADASLDDFVFEIAAGNYTYNISNFGNDDQLDFPVGNEPSVDNTGGFKDNAVDLTWSSAGQTVTIHLTGLAAGQDAQLSFVSDFNTVFGANTII